MKITGFKLTEVFVEFYIDDQKYTATAMPVNGLEAVAITAPAREETPVRAFARVGAIRASKAPKAVRALKAPKAAPVQAEAEPQPESSNGHSRKNGDKRWNAPLSAKNRKIAKLRAAGAKVTEISKKLKLTNFQVYSRLGTVKAYAKRNPDEKLAITW